jgi:hypothetical protein
MSNNSVTSISENINEDSTIISSSIWSRFKAFSKKTIFIYAIIIFVCGFMTFFQGYNKPEGLFWDEASFLWSRIRHWANS